MKLNHASARILRVLALFSTFQLITTSLSAKVFVDPTLEAWSITKSKSNSLTTDERRVLVFLKPGRFHDHTGLNLAGAIAEERAMVSTDLQMKAAEFGAIVKDRKPRSLWASNAVALNVGKAGLKALERRDEVEAIIENRIITLDDPVIQNLKNTTDESKLTYGLQVIHAKEVWDKGVTGKGVIIGVIDTGVDSTHPDLKDKIVRQKDFTSDNDNKDYHGHGTHVSGTIAGGNASGVSIGVAPDARIIMGKVFNSQGGATLEGLLRAMEWMLDPDGDANTADAPRLVSNSWGSGSQFTYGFRNVIRSWKRFNIVPNFAAGNAGSMPFSVNAPGSYPFSFAIGAIDEHLSITSFSSRGPTLWWKVWHPQFVTKPNISAPGLNVLSAISADAGFGKDERFAEKWVQMSGTSMATPHIAGVVALMLQANPNLTEEQIQEILSTTALDRGSKGMNNRFGNGIVQADKAVEKAKTWTTQTPNSHLFFRDRDPSQWEWDTP